MPKKLTKEKFIEKAKKIHRDKYDYSKVEYVNNSTKVCIICSIHGEFWQSPSKHLSGQGCPKCGQIQAHDHNKTTLIGFVEQAKEVHGDKYDYSKVEYVNNSTKVCIICPIHGEFWQIPNSHLNGNGCKECYDDRRGEKQILTTSEFIKRAKEIHENKYDYSKVNYINSHTKVNIICPKHGNFFQTPYCHNLLKQGCPKCANKNVTTEEFIEKAKKIHGDKYDYSKVNYITSIDFITIICPKHGEFKQKPDRHIQGNGCPKCANKNVTTEEYIQKAQKTHGNRYDYSKVKYTKSNEKVCIICKEHGEFWQEASSHLMGGNCPKCNSSHLEEEIRLFLQENNIEFEEQKKFDWLRLQSLDFYLPQYNIGIECQGIQHFQPIELFGGINGLLQTKIRDENKKRLCKENEIKLLYYSNLGIDYQYKVFENKDDLLEEIKKG